MRRLILALTFVVAFGAAALAPTTASASHVPASIACQYFEPHDADTPVPGQQWWTNDGDGAYRCIYRHPDGSTHYYLVCHETYYWWWVPGLSAWVAVDCG